jgi:hypothetical protein
VEKLLSVVFRALERLINLFIVRIWPVLVQLAIFTVRAMLIALAAIWTGWPTAAERIAWEWMGRAARMGIPSSLDKYMFPAMKVVAHFLILYGWMCWAFLTAAIFNGMLRYYFNWWINF